MADEAQENQENSAKNTGRDIYGRPYALIREVIVGTVLIADGDFTCAHDGQYLTVAEDGAGKFISCADGNHYLDGQANDGPTGPDSDFYIGLHLKPGTAINPSAENPLGIAPEWPVKEPVSIPVDLPEIPDAAGLEALDDGALVNLLDAYQISDSLDRADAIAKLQAYRPAPPPEAPPAGDGAVEAVPPARPQIPGDATLEQMPVAQLKDLAEAHGVDPAEAEKPHGLAAALGNVRDRMVDDAPAVTGTVEDVQVAQTVERSQQQSSGPQ